MTLQVGRIPWLGLFLAISFSLYGLIRKKNPLDPIIAFILEASIMAVPALSYLIWISWIPGMSGASHLGQTPSFGTSFTELHKTGLLICGGVLTAMPLLWFTQAVKRLPLSTIGIFQYLAPTLQFLLAIFIFGENFSNAHAQGFALIWVALLIYSSELKVFKF